MVHAFRGRKCRGLSKIGDSNATGARRNNEPPTITPATVIAARCFRSSSKLPMTANETANNHGSNKCNHMLDGLAVHQAIPPNVNPTNPKVATHFVMDVMGLWYRTQARFRASIATRINQGMRRSRPTIRRRIHGRRRTNNNPPVSHQYIRVA